MKLELVGNDIEKIVLEDAIGMKMKKEGVKKIGV